jgi:hypothetical protein
VVCEYVGRIGSGDDGATGSGRIRIRVSVTTEKCPTQSVRLANASRKILEHPKGSLVIVLPKMHSRSVVSPTHLKIVEKTIRDDQVVNWDEFDFYLRHGTRREDFNKKGDRLIWTLPGTAEETKVVAASGEEDGMVIIKRKGSLLRRATSEFRKEEVVELRLARYAAGFRGEGWMFYSDSATSSIACARREFAHAE